MSDTNCPYCDADIEINHDDGCGYSEDRLHEQECDKCGKNFTFSTSIHYYYETFKADCLNGKEHSFKATYTFPKQFTNMRCEFCEEQRQCNNEEMKNILK